MIINCYPLCAHATKKKKLKRLQIKSYIPFTITICIEGPIILSDLEIWHLQLRSKVGEMANECYETSVGATGP